MRIRPFVFGVTVLAAGFLTGIAYTLCAVPERVEARPGVGPVDAALLQRLADLDARLQAQQSEARAQHQGLLRSLSSLRSATASAAAAPPSVHVVPAAKPSAPDAPPARVVQKRSAEATAGLLALKGWRGDAALREKWTSAPAEDVRKWLGQPDRVNVAAKGDTMTYLWKDGDEVEAVGVRLSKGRVADVVLGSAD